MTEKEKLVRTKKDLKAVMFLSVFYLLLVLFSFIEIFFLEIDNSITFSSNVAYFFYIIFIVSLIMVIISVVRYKSPKFIRRKAIKDYDERNRKIQQRANSNTLGMTVLILLIGIVLSASLDSIELFIFCIITLLLIFIMNVISKLVLQKRY